MLLLSQFLIAQNIDSLKQAFKSAKHDTTRAIILVDIGETLYVSNPDTMIIVCEQAISIINKNLSIAKGIEKKAFLKTKALALNDIGFIYKDNGDMKLAIEYFDKSLKIHEELGDKIGISDVLNNIGYVYKEVNDIPKALNYFQKCLRIREESGNKLEIANVMVNIGIIYHDQNNQELAIKYYQKCLRLYEEVNDLIGIGRSLNNLGVIYSDLGDNVKSLKCYSQSLKIRAEINDKSGIAYTLNNIAYIYKKNGNISKALSYYNTSLSIYEEIHNKTGVANTLTFIASCLFNQGNFIDAKKYAERSFKLSKEIDNSDNIKRSSELLSIIYAKLNNWKNAYEMQVLFKLMTDSINNKTNYISSVQKSFQYEYEKKSAADSIKISEEKKVSKAKLAESEASLKQEKTQRFALYGGLLLVLIFTGFVFNRFKITQKQKQIIEIKEQETQTQNKIITQQKHLVEEKHKEITDSINYAERIQRSFLSSKQLLDENLNDYFVFFQPKDVVSGDFYWSSKLNNGQFALVTADSTGHGVPGAIMSLLNITSLESAIKDGYTEPSDILNSTRKTIIERLKKDGSAEGGKDGMDCSIISFDFMNNKLTYAAANNPIWIVRASTSSVGKELIELSPDKMPVGKHDRDTNLFTQNTIDLQKGDIVYAITDGFPDQFGGMKGKKFMYKKLKELLISVSPFAMQKQKEVLIDTLNNWKGDLEQVDDITIIGVRI